jgi:hypothetical protein
MNPSPSKGAASWLREVVENSAALVQVYTPELEHGLRLAREALSLRAGSVTRRQARDRGAGTAATRA